VERKKLAVSAIPDNYLEAEQAQSMQEEEIFVVQLWYGKASRNMTEINRAPVYAAIIHTQSAIALQTWNS